ncbi:hypothetical protein [Thauera phenolivorans]|uniref:hypothetical protein n=1 Tax=Thauera phenolivorans TaxID=1792543 RepID=UPI000A58FC3D|nr:hypothetical protein [Thauera phenolivorans]
MTVAIESGSTTPAATTLGTDAKTSVETPASAPASASLEKPAAAAKTAAVTGKKSAKAEARAEKKPRPEKSVKEAFRLATSERKRIKVMRDDVKAAGRRPTESELIRAAIVRLGSHSSSEILAMVNALPPLEKRKGGKKR